MLFVLCLILSVCQSGDAAWCIWDYCMGKRAIKPPKVTVNDFSWREIAYAVCAMFGEYLRSIGHRVYEIESITALEFFGLAAILYVIYTFIKGRHRTHKDNQKLDQAQQNKIATPMATEVNVNNTVRFEPDTPPHLRHNNRATINNPSTFNDSTNFTIWLTQLEIYLENCCDKSKWFETALSYINPASLSDLHNINEIRNKADNYTQLTEFLRKKYSQKEKSNKPGIADFANRR